MKVQGKTFYQIIGIVAAMGLLLLIVFLFAIRVMWGETQVADKNIENIAHSNASAVLNTFNGYIHTLRGIAVTLEPLEDHQTPDVLTMLNRIARIQGFIRLTIDYPNGVSYTSDGDVLEDPSNGDTCKASQERAYISDVSPSRVNGKSIVSIYVPILDVQGEAVATLRGVLETDTLGESLNLNLYGGDSYYCVIDGAGNYVAHDPRLAIQSGSNYFDALEQYLFEQDFSKESIASAFDAQQEVSSSFIDRDEPYRAYFKPIGINHWMMLVTVPQRSIHAQASNNIRYAMEMMGAVILVLLVLFACVYASQRSMHNAAMLNEKCFRVLAEQTKKAIFEWTFQENKITALSNFNEIFGRDVATHNSAQDALTAKVIHPDDVEIFQTVFSRITNGVSVDSERFRIMNDAGVFRWCELSGIVINDEKGRPYKAVGSLEDIDEQVRREEALYEAARIDSLTKLYNKKAAELLAKEILTESSEDKMHAVVCVDLDNFKSINDSFGHQYGDAVLIEIADVIKQSFRSTDVLGRFGGDEFILFIKNIPNVGFIRDKAHKLNVEINRTYTQSGVSHTISASIGVSIYPRDGLDYEELYNKADTASYIIKKHGKNGTAFYGQQES